jgi:hypothetical protein
MNQLFLGSSTTFGIANRLETFIGLEEQVNIGGTMELKVGPSVEFGFLECEAWLSKKLGYVDSTSASINEIDAKLNDTRAALKQTSGILMNGEAGIKRAGCYLNFMM